MTQNIYEVTMKLSQKYEKNVFVASDVRFRYLLSVRSDSSLASKMRFSAHEENRSIVDCRQGYQLSTYVLYCIIEIISYQLHKYFVSSSIGFLIFEMY